MARSKVRLLFFVITVVLTARSAKGATRDVQVQYNGSVVLFREGLSGSDRARFEALASFQLQCMADGEPVYLSPDDTILVPPFLKAEALPPGRNPEETHFKFPLAEARHALVEELREEASLPSKSQNASRGQKPSRHSIFTPLDRLEHVPSAPPTFYIAQRAVVRVDRTSENNDAMSAREEVMVDSAPRASSSPEFLPPWTLKPLFGMHYPPPITDLFQPEWVRHLNTAQEHCDYLFA